jgi:hypothetical protein
MGCSAHNTCRLTEAEAMKVTAVSARGRRLLITASTLSLSKQVQIRECSPCAVVEDIVQLSGGYHCTAPVCGAVL